MLSRYIYETDTELITDKVCFVILFIVLSIWNVKQFHQVNYLMKAHCFELLNV